MPGTGAKSPQSALFSKIVKNKIVLMEMYRHATRADSAELATEKSCRPAPTKRIFGGGLEYISSIFDGTFGRFC